MDDSDSNNAYGQAYGEENPEDKEGKDLVPLECQDCGQINASTGIDTTGVKDFWR